MSISGQVVIITKGTCILRGASKSDVYGPKRYFGYYGAEANIDQYMKSHEFVSRYAQDGQYQYYRVEKNLSLLMLPYISLMMFSDSEEEYALELKQSLSAYVASGNSSTADKHGMEETIDAICGVLDEDCTTTFAQNPDTPFSDLICELGFHGWVRKGTSQGYTQADELMICNIGDMTSGGYLVESDTCKLK